MKTTTRFAALTLSLTLGAGIVTAPLAARASEEGKRNTVLGLGAAAAALLLTQKNKLPGVVVAGAAVVAATQLGHDRRDHYRNDYGYDNYRHDDYRNDNYRHDDRYGYNDNHGYNNGYDNRSHDDYRSDNHGGYNAGSYRNDSYNSTGSYRNDNHGSASGYRVGQNESPRYDDYNSRAARPRTARAFGGTR